MYRNWEIDVVEDGDTIALEGNEQPI